MEQECTLFIPEFHVEPQQQADSRWRRSQSEQGAMRLSQAQAAIESMLLSLRFRNFLTSGERQLLDVLAADKTITFLIRGRDYVHPREFEPFPLDQVVSSLVPGSGAIFVHRYYPPANEDQHCRKVHTSRVGSMADGDLILGMLGPDREGSSYQELHFERLADMFRQMWSRTEVVASAISSYLSTGEPVILINRASGRVILASEAVEKALDISSSDLLGQEYRQVQHMLAGRLAGQQRSLRNVDINGIYLCVVTLNAGPAMPPDTGTGDSARFLIHGMRNKLAAVMAASSHLQIAAEDLTPANHSELTSIIEQQTRAADQYLDRLTLLTTGSQRPVELTAIGSTLVQAMDLVRQSFGSTADIIVEPDGCDGEIEAPRSSLMYLVDAVLRSHLTGLHGRSHTDMRVDATEHMLNLHIATRSEDAGHVMKMEHSWRMYAQQLAELMNMRVDFGAAHGSSRMQTTVEMPLHNPINRKEAEYA
jgi:hypothetical protein